MVYLCTYPECKKRLSSKYNLKRHIECCHKKIRRFECMVCFKKFSSAQNLKEHMFLHDDIQQQEQIKMPENYVPDRNIGVPKLTDLVFLSIDPEIRPLMKVIRLYPYAPVTVTKI
ncbi:unnamed protein product [Blepharisma stoltei]|uniref:C2H2-type domain-containing protein n=1 Tax=Blepharisma stoltei TaxID=1481888 RepID=A0AAU9JTC3_9CILI|nr:unnamed protein product [Blepharisma stoltei]